jgi:DNA-binding IclR family transcriptional regulator
VRSHKPARRRRTEPRRAPDLPLDQALAILELLAARPAGLTVCDIATRLECPAAQVMGAIAILQRRGWLQRLADGDRLVLGEFVAGLAEGR